nr:MAG TPA_asm: hypothetical protein [Caudoviricetes sp.]
MTLGFDFINHPRSPFFKARWRSLSAFPEGAGFDFDLGFWVLNSGRDLGLTFHVSRFTFHVSTTVYGCKVLRFLGSYGQGVPRQITVKARFQLNHQSSN